MKTFLLAALLLSPALAQNAGTLGPDAVKDVPLASLARHQLSVTISPNFQVQLSLPASVDAVAGNKPDLVRVTVMPAPLDRFVFLDALAAQGSADLTVFVDGQPLRFKLVIDGRGLDGIREYAIQDDAPAPPQAATRPAPVPPTPPAPGTRAGAAPPSAPLNQAAPAAPELTLPTGPTDVQAVPELTPIVPTYRANRDASGVTIAYTLTNHGRSTLVANDRDLQALRPDGTPLPVQRVRPSALSLLLPGRSLQGVLHLSGALDEVRLVWPLSDLSVPRVNSLVERTLRVPR